MQCAKRGNSVYLSVNRHSLLMFVTQVLQSDLYGVLFWIGAICVTEANNCEQLLLFRSKNLVIKMMNVGGRAVGRAGFNSLFLEHNSATVRNILMILGRIIEQDSTEC